MIKFFIFIAIIAIVGLSVAYTIKYLIHVVKWNVDKKNSCKKV